VDGERMTMKRAFHPDAVLSTSRQSKARSGRLVDGLDIPIVNMWDTSFSRNTKSRTDIPITTSTKTTDARCPAVIIADEVSYEPHRDRLMKMAKRGDLDPRQGFKLEYRNASTEARRGRPSVHISAAAKGFTGQPSPRDRRDDFCAVEGRGTTTIGDTTFDWLPRDILWRRHGTRCAPGRGRFGAIQLFRPSRTEGTGNLARRGVIGRSASAVAIGSWRWKPPSLPRPLSPHGSCRRRGTSGSTSATSWLFAAAGRYLAATLAGQRGR